MKMHNLSVITMAAGLLMASPAFAQTPTPDTHAAAQKPHAQTGSPTTVGAASKVSKQRTDGDSPTMVGPASGAYKQRTQSMSHSDPGVMKQN